MRILIMGPPGAGKGTQATCLSERFGTPHISTGDLFRDHLEKWTVFGREAERYIDTGDPVPNEIAFEMIKRRLAMHDSADGFILDGFPRNTFQAVQLNKLLTGLSQKLDAVIHFQLDDEEAVKRLIGRGSSDDAEDVIRNRQEIYRRETAPIIEFYRELLVVVDAVGSVKEVANRALDQVTDFIMDSWSLGQPEVRQGSANAKRSLPNWSGFWQRKG